MQKSGISGIFVTLHAKLSKDYNLKQKKDTDMQPEFNSKEDLEMLSKIRDNMRSSLHVTR